MINDPYVSNISFKKTKGTFSNKTRAVVTTKNHQISIATKMHAPHFFQKMLWKKMEYTDASGNVTQFYANRRSLANRTQTPVSFVNFSFKNKENKDLSHMMVSLHKVHKISLVLNVEENASSSESKSIKLIKRVEKNRDQYINQAMKSGSFVKEWKDGRYLIVHYDSTTDNVEFYLSLSKHLGSGGMKEVQAMFSYKTGKANYALSIQNGGDLNLPKFGEKVTSQMDSKQILKTKFNIEVDNKAFIGTKRCIGDFDALADLNVPFKDKLGAFLEVLNGVEALHEKGIIHRDLKQENILYKNKESPFKIKIIDFDLACYAGNEEELSVIAGTTYFIPPEVYLQREIVYPTAIDCWSLGIILYELCGNGPMVNVDFLEKSSREKAQALQDAVINLPLNEFTKNSPLLPVIQGLLAYNPEFRMTVDEAREAIEAYRNTL